MPNVNKNKVYALGAWRNVSAQYVKVGGVWKAVTGVYSKVGGSWKTSYPFPLSADASLATLTVNGSDVLTSGAVTVPNGTTSVTVAATTTNPAATITSGTGTKTVNISTNPNSLSVLVTAEDGITTRTYTFTVTVAAPATVTIYWAYCSGYNPPVTGNGTVSGTSDPSVACNQKKSELGNPSNWVCQGGSAPTAPNCGNPPPSPCCTEDYTVYDGYRVVAGTKICNYTRYYVDPCAGTTCPPSHPTYSTCLACACPI